MSEETTAPEADETLPAADAPATDTPAPDAPAAEEQAPEAPEAQGANDAPEGESLLERIEEEGKVLLGGILGDVERKPEAAPHEVEAIRLGESIITRAQLAEIKLRRAQADLPTLIAAVEKLLDELDATQAGA